MKRMDRWDGQLEKAGVEFETIQSISDLVADSNVHVLTAGNRWEYDEPDKSDYLVAASCGLLTGLLDAFWVNEFSLVKAQEWGRSRINSFVINVAGTCGYHGEDLVGAIRYLEKRAPIPSDQLTPLWGGGLQHHLRDFSHHASISGLVFSLLTQFTGLSFGTNTEGLFEVHEISDKSLIGKTIEEKIFNGSVIWAIHLVSDMAGSSGRAGRGTGIPGPILSLAKELSVLPRIRDLKIDYHGKEISISTMLSKIFNGTAFQHTDNSDITRFDLRTEIGTYAFGVKQSIPVIINQCLVRSFYFLKRLLIEISNKQINGIRDITKLEPSRFWPGKNKCITRMMTISSGVFCVVDASDATIRSLVAAPKGKADFVKNALLRANFIGIVSFAISIKNDIATNFLEKRKQIIGGELGEMYIEERISLDSISIEVDVKIDSKGLYEYAFYRMLKSVDRYKRSIDEGLSVELSLQRRLLQLDDYDTKIYTKVSNYAFDVLLSGTEQLMKRLFVVYEIEYDVLSEEESRREHIPFYRVENDKKIGYLFTDNIMRRIDWKRIKDKYNLDAINVVAMVELGNDSDTRNSIIGEEVRRANGFVQYMTLKDLFAIIPENEYEVYMSHLTKYKEGVRKLIGYSKIVSSKQEANNKAVESRHDISFSLIEEWLDRIISGDVLLPLSSRIYFGIRFWGTDQCKLEFSTCSGFTDNGIPENSKWPYIDDELTWDRATDDKDSIEAVVVSLLREYLLNGKYKQNLKSYSMIATGWLGSPIILHQSKVN